MTRSIFDPTGGNTERSGSRNLGPPAEDFSHLPAEVTDETIPDTEVMDVQLDLIDPDKPPLPKTATPEKPGSAV